MGALHEGHLTLVRRAATENDLAVASVFVNPLQFDDPADLAAYPRDVAADARQLSASGCDMAFTGTIEGFFPSAADAETIRLRDPGPAARGLEGEHRAGHFEGVVTIVERLFDLVLPTRAYFGAKDYQQCMVVRDLALARGDVEVIICETVRDADGLALSSRNARLSGEDRGAALALHAALLAARAAWTRGERDAERLCAVLEDALRREGVEIEYAEVRDPEAWTAARPRGTLLRARALIAARVGGVRLIDNLRLDG